jgi:hypothetical protein
MAGHADDAVEQIVTAAHVVILDHVVALLLAGGQFVVAGQPFGFHEVLVLLEILAVNGPPPAFTRCEIVEVIAPFSELHGGENIGSVHGLQRRLVLRAEHTASAFDLHLSAGST